MQCGRRNILQSLLSELECPVCMEYMVSPILMCVKGHTICDICRPKIPECPTCRQKFSNTRNIPLEKLAREVKYPCSYQKLGCEEHFDHDTVREHQLRCHYRPQTCPACQRLNVKCGWTGIYNDIKKHLMEKHRGECYEYVDGKFRVLRNIEPCMILSQFVLALNEVFFLTFQANNDTLYAVLLYVGPSENAAKYKYKVKFVNKDETEGVTVMHLTRSFDENLNEIFKSGDCGKLHYDVVRRLETKEGGLKFKTKIFQVAE
jgi:E3 ubiquitin-protein ligase SIAH1